MERRRINIINPAAGNGKGIKPSSQIAAAVGGEVFLTKKAGDLEGCIADNLSHDPYCHFVVYGGDGTINCCVNAIMQTGCSETAAFSAFSVGSGNDFLRYIDSDENPMMADEDGYMLDLLVSDGHYSANVLNAGFDCTVVSKAGEIRHSARFVGGSLSYKLGVLDTLLKKKCFTTNAVFTYPDGTTETMPGIKLLIAAANCPYYGGGYMVAPFARPDDGIMDVLVAKDLTRLKFINLVGYYRKGTHLKNDGSAIDEFGGIIEYRRCVRIEYDGISEICSDGEIYPASKADISVVPKALRYIPLDIAGKVKYNKLERRSV